MASNASQGATEHSFDHQERGHQFRMMEQDYASGSEADYSPVKADVDDKLHRREAALAKIDKLRKVREGMRSKALEDAKCRMTEVVRKIKKRGEEAQDHRGGKTKQRVAYAGRPWPLRRPPCKITKVEGNIKKRGEKLELADLRHSFVSGTMQMQQKRETCILSAFAGDEKKETMERKEKLLFQRSRLRSAGSQRSTRMRRVGSQRAKHQQQHRGHSRVFLGSLLCYQGLKS